MAETSKASKGARMFRVHYDSPSLTATMSGQSAPASAGGSASSKAGSAGAPWVKVGTMRAGRVQEELPFDDVLRLGLSQFLATGELEKLEVRPRR